MVSPVKEALAVEEILIRFKEKYGTDTPCSLIGRKIFGRITFSVQQQGPHLNPLSIEEDIEISINILEKMGYSPQYTWRERNGGQNCVKYNAALKPIKNKLLIQMMIAVVLSLITYFILLQCPANVLKGVEDGLINPIFSKLMAVISALATPLIFFCVISGIAGIGDVASLGKMGKVFFFRMMLTYLIAILCLGVFGIITYPVNLTGSSSGSGILPQLVELVLNIIPGNIFMPFTTDNDLQVITIAIFVGIVMLLMGDSLKKVNEICKELTDLVNRMMYVFDRLLPLIVYLGIMNMLCSGNLNRIAKIYKAFILFAVISMIVVIIMIVRTVVTIKAPFPVIFKKQIPTLMINLTTSSQVAALPENMKCCKEKW